ncbi:chromosome partitioning protein ParB [Variovorax sp. WS11]|uniref:ParB/RepB/Spo0J family partition protein n=1 Tax=Variovorax sp. WS11 TaxID=1105204 RepID=UPI000D0DE823|nr:ParB/RepB/Spo0J family partition protein [Variovorax sp. WS11]NDZ17234.1 ParB/RepB/Spo0J family partition protein [Variovorax sp. WS11]PSL81090.1 chromosome partitioning protein ParB [Variovorax sp. WS11]
MANKDLVKRAFSVTANLPTASQQRQDTASTSEAGLDGTKGSEAPATIASATPNKPAAVPVAPKTGPGSMLAFMTDQSEVHREVLRLRERLSDFDGAQATRAIDPKLIKASSWANRDLSHFKTEAFTRLKEEIASAGGNVQPIKVRPIEGAAAGSPSFEIVFGHRRHQACLELGLPVLALVQPDMRDAELFVEMERENREREDLSAWEQGVMYMRALEQGLFPSAKQLAAAIDRDLGNIGKAMALAKLPGEVVRAFGSPLNLQFRWATPLKDAHQRDPEGLLAASRELTTRVPPPSPAEVFAELTAQGGVHRQAPGTTAEWKDDAGKRIASLVVDRKGRVTLSFDQPMAEAQRRKLVKLMDGFVGSKA